MFDLSMEIADIRKTSPSQIYPEPAGTFSVEHCIELFGF
jgi:hypothetical protein